MRNPTRDEAPIQRLSVYARLHDITQNKGGQLRGVFKRYMLASKTSHRVSKKDNCVGNVNGKVMNATRDETPIQRLSVYARL